MPADQAPVYIAEDPLSGFTSSIGTGPALPTRVRVTTPGTYSIVDYAVPADSDVTVTLVGGGGGGSTQDGETKNGPGGGGGAGIVALIPAATWALGGTLVVGAKGLHATDAPPDDGTSGGNSTLTIDGDLLLSAGGGAHAVAVSATGGAGGTATVDGSITATVTRNGHAGQNGTTTTVGAGGPAPLGGSGSGGKGGSLLVNDQADGTDGFAILSWAV